MLAAAAATGRSTYLYWLPCRGEGTIIHPTGDDGGCYEDFGRFAFAFDTKMFACDRRMDGGDAPWTSELNIAATALLGVAWLALVLGMRWQLRTKAVAALPSLATLAVAAALAMDGGDQDRSFPVLLMLGIELSAAVALFAIMARQRDVDVRRLLRLLVVLCAHQREPRTMSPRWTLVQVQLPRLSAVFATRSSGRYSPIGRFGAWSSAWSPTRLEHGPACVMLIAQASIVTAQHGSQCEDDR